MLSGRLWANGEVWAGHRPASPPMGLVNLRKNHNVVRGHRGITSHGRRIVRQGAFLLEDGVGRDCLSFLTCTLPGSTIDECRAANSAWPEIMRRFLQELRRELERKNAPGWFVGCTEIQPKRLKATGQPWPHLHLVFTGRTGKPWLIGKFRITALWARVVNAVLGIPFEELSYATTIKRLEGNKSCAHYLGKYMSKGQEDLAPILDADPTFPLPHSWHHCSHDLNQLIQLSTETLKPQTASWVMQLLKTKFPGSKLFAEIRPDSTEENPSTAPMGYCGCLDPPLASRVIAHNRSLNLAYG